MAQKCPFQVLKNHGYLKLKDLPCKSDTGKILLAESQIKATDPSVAITDSLASEYDSADESSVCSTPLPLLEKKVGDEPVSGPMTIKSIFKSKSTFKAETLKGVIINEPSSALTKCERNDHRTCDHVEYMSTMNMSQHLKGQGGSSLRSKTPRPSKHFFPPCIHCGSSDHLSDDCVNYPICDICGSYDHDIHVHNTTDHNDIEWFRRGEALQAKKAEALKTYNIESINANKSKTPTKSNYGVLGES
ncbi:hypothetical protein Tco_0140987 [Tanacetum coccineum]